MFKLYSGFVSRKPLFFFFRGGENFRIAAIRLPGPAAVRKRNSLRYDVVRLQEIDTRRIIPV